MLVQDDPIDFPGPRRILARCWEVDRESGAVIVGCDGRPAIAMCEDARREGCRVKETVWAGNELVGIFKVGKQLDSSAETDGVVPARCPDFKTVYTCAEVDRPF